MWNTLSMNTKTKIVLITAATLIPGGFIALGTIWIYRKVAKKLKNNEEQEVMNLERWRREK